MKSVKLLLFVLAGSWIALLLVDKSVESARKFQMRKSPWVFRAGSSSVQFLKSLLMLGLAVVNLFMAISLLDSRKR